MSAMNVQNVSTATPPKLETLWAGDQKVATSPVENDTVSSKGLQGPSVDARGLGTLFSLLSA